MIIGRKRTQVVMIYRGVERRHRVRDGRAFVKMLTADGAIILRRRVSVRNVEAQDTLIDPANRLIGRPENPILASQRSTAGTGQHFPCPLRYSFRPRRPSTLD